MEEIQDIFELSCTQIEQKLVSLDFSQELSFFASLNFTKRKQNLKFLSKINSFNGEKPFKISNFFKKMLALFIYSFKREKRTIAEELKKLREELAECYYDMFISSEINNLFVFLFILIKDLSNSSDSKLNFILFSLTMLCMISLFRMAPLLRQRLNRNFFVRSLQILFSAVHDLNISVEFVNFYLKLFFVEDVFSKLSAFMKEDAIKREEGTQNKEKIEENEEQVFFLGIKLNTIPKKTVLFEKF
jgi:hypothetical protein